MTDSQNKNPFADPNYGKDLNSNGNSNPFSDPDYGKEQKKGIKGHLQDTGLSALKGAVAVPELAVGIMDVMSDGAVGKTLENKDGAIGFRPKEAKQALGDLHTDQYKAQQQEFADAGKDGNWVDKVVDKTKVALTNPSLIANTVVESVPSMLAGGALGRASGIANPVVAGAVGEGAVMAGSQAEQIRQETVDGRLTADQSLAGVGTGALGGLIGFAGGRLAQKMGIGDVDTMLVTGRAGPADIASEIASMPAKSLPRRVIEGAISEGFLEELPQSVSEQVIQNLALDKPWHDGIEDAAVMGTLAGMAMGGAANILSGHNTGTESQDNQQQSGSPNLPSAPPQLGSSPDNALTGEYIPREDVSQGGNQGRTAFVYDQPSMDADNLLNNNGFDYGGAANGNPTSPDTPPAPNGNYFDGDYGSEAAFDDLLNSVPPASQTPSQQMGINPNDGPMSSAAALAVDSGASPVTPQLGYAEQQTQEQSNAPISDAVPSNYQSLLGSQNNGQPFNADLEGATAQQENTQADNAGKSISQQNDLNATDAMGGAIETDTAQTATTQTVQPILGQDGKNKWFGTQDKAQAFIDKKKLGNDYQVVQDGKRFEIQPKAKSQVQDDAYFQSQLDQLDKQRAQFEATGDYASAEKIYDEMQTVAREWQTNPSTATPTTKRAEPSKGASDNAWGDFYRKNRNMISEELFMGGHQDRNTLEEAAPEIKSRHAHGMAKATPAAAVRDLKDILENGIDQNRGQGRLFTAPLSQGELTAEQRSAMSASGTSSGSAYSDGAFTLIAKEGVGDIRSVSEIDAVMVNSAVPQEVVNGLRQDFPNMKFGYAKELPSLLSGGKQSNNAQAQVTDLEQQLANEKSVAKKAQIRKQITELQNGLTEQAQNTVSLNQPQKTTVENLSGELKKIEESTIRINAVRQRIREANPEIFTAENDRVRETHGLTNARVTMMADEIETSGSYELSDREYEKIKNNPNYKIDYDVRNFMGKVTAVKDPHSGEWVGNNEQSDLDNAAHEAATSVHNDLPEPTQAQIEAGNYKKGHIKVHGLDIAVENPRGSERRGTDPNGKEWAHTMSDHYGYIKRTKGADNEHIDTYIGNNPDSNQVFIVDQIDQASGNFDEHKVMLGFNNQEEATTAYKSNFDKGWKVGPIRNMDMEQFKDWLKNGDTSKPATDNKAKLPTALRDQQQPSDEVNQNKSILQDNEVIHIEGKKSESATKNVVEKSFDKAEGNLTKAQYEKMRNGLIADIEQAIAIAPNEATEKITFDVKGDGKFKVHNDKTTLSKFLKQVKANSGFKAPTKPKKSNGITVGSFNAINSIKAMLTDQVDEYSIFNAYQMAQNADIQTIFVKDQSKVEPYFVVEQVTEVDGNPFYLVLRKEKQGTSFLVVSQYGGRLGDSASLASKAKENGLAKINKSGQELLLKALRGERERLKDVTQENLKTQFEQKMAEVFGDDVENTSNAIQDEDGIERVQDNRSDRKESIQDLGEKIGGARKDTAVSTGKAKKTKSTDDRPTWAKRYTVSEIVTSTNSNEIGKWVIEDSKKTDWKGIPKKLGTFDSEQEAQDMLPVVAVGLKHRIYARRDGKSGFEIWRQISDVKRVKVVNQVFDTKQDAQTYLIKNATNILETSTTFGELDLPRPENTVRRGTERRKGDAKDTDFMKVFGFRGVEFGNWNNQEERQQLLNDAYDGLLDLAEVLKIPAKAISLNGDLALAFGARGQGLSSARAHYEPAKVVINLTKMNGAGSLAHEWWHAFDHYLARQDGIASAKWVVDADGTRSLKISNNSKDRMVSHGFSYRNSGVREDVRNAYTDLMKTMSTKAEQYVEDVQAVDKFVGQSRDRVKEQLDSLREELSRQRDPKYYKRHNKPASAEQLVVFDTISQKLINGELLETEWRTDVKNKSARGIFSGARWSNDALEQLGEIYKSVRGRSGFSKDQDAVLDRLRSAMNSYANRLKMLADAQKEVSKTRKIPTKFVMDARNLDEGRGSDYWTTPHELSARAFQGFVEDKISENNGHSPFLNHAPENAAIETPWGWMRPYPHGDERKAINAKFTDLVDTLKTEETETGIKLYSRNKLKPDEDRKGASPLSTLFSPLSVNVVDRLVTDILSRITKGNAPSKSNRGINGIVQPKFPYIIVESFETLPEAIQQENYYQDEDGNTKRYDVSAVWHKGTLYINAGDIQGNHNTQQTTYEAYEEVILHEVVGHFGVQQLFGQDYKKKFQQLFNALGGIEGIRKIAKDNGVDMNQFDNSYIKPFKKGVEEGYYDPLDAQQATVSELFAFIAQNAKSRPFVRQKLKEVIGYIRQWFRERGFDKFLARYNDADLMMFLSEARKAVIDQKYFGKFKDQKIANNKNDSDQPLYSRKRENSTGINVQQVRDVLVDRFGKETIDELERQGKLEIIQDYQVEGVEGFYYNGKAVLVASNLTDQSVIPTFLHELGGHAGFQNMMTQKQYNELMNQFNKLVDQGNPVAMAAKLLAEREQGSERQHLEYLPYLLTLSSTMQQRNVVQRNALQKLINNLVTYVKATLFDNFGINLNLNPNDIVALAERMIEKSSYNAENATSPLYSRQFFDNTINNLSESIKHLSAKSIKDKTGYKFTDWLGIGLSALGRRQLTEIYSKILPQLNKYNELAAQMDADKNDAGAEADSIVREWANLNDEDQLAELMHDSTLAKIDPTKPYVKGDSVSRYKQLRDDYNSLSPEAQAMYLKARDAYKKHYAKVHQAIKERILRSELSSQKKADLLKQMDDNFFGYVKGVYFPLARFGKYVVVMRNQNGEVESVSRAETMGEAQSLRSELMQKYPHYKTDRVVLDKEFNASRDAVGRGFMTNLFAEVDNLGLSTAEQAEFEDTLSQLYLSSMPDLSWAKHGIHRKGTAGFSQDARRAFAQNMFHGAGYLAKLRYGDQLAQQLDDMQKYASEQSKLNDSYDQPTAQRVIDEMNKRHDNLMNPKGHPLSSALTSLGFIYYLGLSPAAAMVNLSQTALVAYPIMGAKWGFDKAANELLKASNDFRKGVEFHKVKWEGSKTDLYKTISSDISKFLSKDEKQAYEDAVARGVIDVTQAHDLAGIAQGEDSGIMWKTRPIMRAASVMFHSAERFNREVTFIAAYRLARQSGEKHDSAFDQAMDATYRGHFDYSSGNRPRIMQGNVAKVLLLFKQFGQNMVYTLARQTYQSIKGETEAERKEARKSLAAILAMHATFAGALGLPMVGMLLSVASWMGGDDDDPWDAEVALRNYLAEAFNPTISNMLMKGAPRGIGVDISGRVGINNLLLPDVQEGLEGKKWWDSASAAALGPIGGIGANVAKGAQEISEGHNLRGVESMLPVFLKNFAKAYRYADEGVQDKTGVSIMDEVSSMDLLVQGMGFSPSDIRTAYEGKSAVYQLNRKLNERRSRLMALWSRAKMMDDQQEMDEIWEEIQGFNDKNPSRRITKINLNQSYRNRQRRIDRAEDGVYLPRNRQDARDAGYFAFGE
ncbi:PLxRFG domain-containing protein [Acinetobacter junii]|uniref:PLxRFG domain-containing protein n=1 Tax=Acinetobacter junii TaxID=40215 RepID=UPI0006947480|nr:PLxRFG domain-containing protein [Acinetobacter junii]